MNKSQSIGIWIVISILFLAFASIMFSGNTNATEEISYTDFISKVKSSEIKQVVIENDVVTEYVIKSYMEKSSSEMTEEEWAEWVHNLQSRLEKSTDFLRIDTIYDYIDRDILDARHSYSRYPDCYYANISAEYLEEFPFISYYKGKFLIMQEDLDGNGATIEIKIENFKEN